MGDKIEKHLDGVDNERREAILKLVRGAAFAVPVVASFALDGRMALGGIMMSSNTSSSGAVPA